MNIRSLGAMQGIALARWAAVVGLAAASSWVIGCGDGTSSEGEVGLTDADGDGVSAALDCDDDDPEVRGPKRWFADADGDGRGDPGVSLGSCQQPAGYVADSSDEAPACATNNPDMCGVCGGPGGTVWYPDVDGDGAGDSALGVELCDAPAGWVAEGGDPEPMCATDDCGPCGSAGSVMAWPDTDGDGLGDGRSGLEVCAIPEGFADNGDDPEPECATNDTDVCGVCGGPGVTVVYPDADGDGLGDGAQPFEACSTLGGVVLNGDDPEPTCATNDTDSCEVCGGGNAALDCFGVCFGEGVIDACGDCGGTGPQLLYADADGDGLGDPDTLQEVCGSLVGFVDNGEDLEPDCRTNNTDACGVCGGAGARFFYKDEDGDGLGDPNVATATRTCAAPSGYVDNSRDAEPTCATNDTDSCGVCGGGNAAMDCYGVCDGAAYHDSCDRCVGGTTGREPATEDLDGNGTPDLCEDCIEQRRAIIQWTNVPAYGNGRTDTYSFQVILSEDGTITIQYGAVEPFRLDATIGIQAPNGASAVEVSSGTLFPTEHPVVQLVRNPEGAVAPYTADYFGDLYWLDIQGVGRPLGLGDDGNASVDLGFAFPFYDQTVERVTVNANGLIGISLQEGQNYMNTPLPNAGLGSLIAALWDDLNPASGGEVYVYTMEPTCERDCNDVVGGLARPSSCGGCVTGPEFGPVQDCNGTCGGTAFTDACGRCVEGNTGLEAQSPDCAGECGGEAYRDTCGVCVGGSTGLEDSDPEDCPAGVDLIVDESYLRQTVRLDHVNVAANDCLIQERCVQGPGDRKVIRFGTSIANIGTEDLVLGQPTGDNPNWTFDTCHNHYHFPAYAAYDIVDLANNEQLDIGTKNGFCVLDIGVYDPMLAPNGCNGYSCGNQGITAGCQDTYSSSLQCQWVDVTGLPDGEYEIIVTTNPDGLLAERDTTNNSAKVRVRMTGEVVEVIE